MVDSQRRLAVALVLAGARGFPPGTGADEVAAGTAQSWTTSGLGDQAEPGEDDEKSDVDRTGGGAPTEQTRDNGGPRDEAAAEPPRPPRDVDAAADAEVTEDSLDDTAADPDTEGADEDTDRPTRSSGRRRGASGDEGGDDRVHVARPRAGTTRRKLSSAAASSRTTASSGSESAGGRRARTPRS